MAKKNDWDDLRLSVEVGEDVINKVRTGEITHIALDITDNNYRQILHSIDGNLVLVVDDLPDTFHGCYFYNNGVFPYAIKETLDFLMLKDDKEKCLVKIISVNTGPGIRFRFQGPGKPSIEDPEGDNCIWQVQFEVVPVHEEPRIYLMRWNPKISSFKEKDYKECLANMKDGTFRMNWSIYDWQEARRGDLFYMLRTGDKKAGIVFQGQFLSDPYPGEDWAGTNRRRMYVDMICTDISKPKGLPRISLDKLQLAIPSIEWSKGHSGELLPPDVIIKIFELWVKE